MSSPARVQKTSKAASSVSPDLSSLFEKPIAFHRIFAQIMGSASGGLFLSQLVYWSQSMKRRQFYKTLNDWRDETMLSRREIEKARKKLEAVEILEVERKGVPARLFFKLNHDKLNDCILQFVTSSKLENEPKNRDASLSHLTNCNATSGKQESHIEQTITESNQRTNKETSPSGTGACSAPDETQLDNTQDEKPEQVKVKSRQEQIKPAINILVEPRGRTRALKAIQKECKAMTVDSITSALFTLSDSNMGAMAERLLTADEVISYLITVARNE